jgi:hypothetical protein
MTILSAMLLLLAGTSEGRVAFERDGVRVGAVLVTDAQVQLKDGPSGLIVVSRICVEPLAAPVGVLLAPGREIVVEPGVRLTRTQAGFELTAHLRKKVLFRAGADSFEIPCPAIVVLGETGWLLGVGRPIDVASLSVSQAQDEVDKTLQDLQKDKEKLQQPKQEAPPPPAAPPAGPTSQGAWPYGALWGQGAPVPPWFPAAPTALGAGAPPLYFYLFASYNPFVSSQAVDSHVILTLDEVSPTGF